MDREGISGFKTSIRTGRTMQQIAQNSQAQKIQNPFGFTSVQLAKLTAKPPTGEEWLFEVKYDGYRILAVVEEDKTVLFTRNGFDYTHKFSIIADALSHWSKGRAFILDGEMIITDKEGKSDFQALQNYLRQKKDKHLTFVVFDILALDGVDLRNHTLKERKQILHQLLTDAPKSIIYSQHIEGSGQECFEAACRLKLEGIIGKKTNSVYSGGTRNGDWVKIKCDNRQEFVIGGFTKTDKNISGISALLLGVYQDKDFVYVGRVGTGFNQRNTKELLKKLTSIITDKPFFIKSPRKSKDETLTWVKPKLVAEVKFSQWTKGNQIRQASFKGLRIDKKAEEVVMEQSQDKTEERTERDTISNNNNEVAKNTFENIKITNPDKVIFTSPIVKKIDVINYYWAVAQRMMPFVSNRILSVVRCPKGVESACFYKKHPTDTLNDGIGKINVSTSSGKNDEYFYIKNPQGLIWEAQMGTLEFHIWGSQISNNETPDMMVFDLDPDENMDINQIRQGVRDLKSILDQLNLVSYLKTSGGKGYHVVVPFVPSVKWDAFYAFSKRIVVVMENKWQDLYTSNIRKEKRKGKIYIDWVRNGRGATSIAPYSLRARQGATVSMPIFWSELDEIKPNDITIKDALNRIKLSDPWKNFFKNSQQLNI